MSHTPGPWFVHSDTLVTTNEDGRKGESIAYAGDTTIQVFHRSNAADNARLVAAAPDLLEALQSLLKVVERTPQATEGFNMLAVARSREAIHKTIG